MSASYPGSAKVFTARSAGQTIASAHINDLQDEVNAIETGLLAGTAPLNSSNTVVNNLQVSGNSTITGSLAVASLTVGGVAVSSAFLTVPTCRVTQSTAANVNNATLTGLNWDVEDFDASGMHSTSVNSSRITFAASTGVYSVGACVEWSVNVNFTRRIRLVLNDGQPFAAASQDQITASDAGQNVMGLVRATSTADYVTVAVFQNSGSTMSCGQISTSLITAFWAHRVSL